MGFSLKKIGKTVTNTIKNPGNALKKVAVTAGGAAAGFVTGGPAGAAAGAVTGAIKASKHGKAPALNLRTAYQTAIAGGAAGLVTGIASKAITSQGGIKALAGKGLGKAVAFGKSGGLSKYAPQVLTFAGKGFKSFGGKAASTAEEIYSEAEQALVPQTAEGKPDYRNVWKNAYSATRGIKDRVDNILHPDQQESPVVTDSAPSEGGGKNGWLAPVVLAGSTLFLMG
jgi:hypothetical protein